MEQDYQGFLFCVQDVPLAEQSPNLIPPDQPKTFEGCMAKSGYDPKAMTYEDALVLAQSQKDYALRHPEPTVGDYLGVLAFLAIPTIVILSFFFGIRSFIRARKQWEQLPTLDSYLAAHPECRTGAGIKCTSCGSKSMRNWGLFSAADSRRSFICNSCGAPLYRQGGRSR